MDIKGANVSLPHVPTFKPGFHVLPCALAAGTVGCLTYCRASLFAPSCSPWVKRPDVYFLSSGYS